MLLMLQGEQAVLTVLKAKEWGLILHVDVVICLLGHRGREIVWLVGCDLQSQAHGVSVA